MNDVLALAATQHGVVTLAQSLVWVTYAAIRHAVAVGMFDRPYRGILRVAGSVPTWQQDLMVLLLRAGAEAAVSHQAAARLWGLNHFEDALACVVVPRRPHRTLGGAVHHTAFLPAHHITQLDGIRVTTAARTVLDVIGRKPYVHDVDAAFWVVNDALRRKLTTIHELRAVMLECAACGRNGVGVMRQVLDRISPSYVPTASELEDLVLRVLAAAGLPAPSRQRSVGGTRAPVGRVDFYYPEWRLVIEADSERWHAGWAQQEADRERDLKLMATGIRVMRVTWRQLKSKPELLVDAVRAVQRAALVEDAAE